MLKRLLLAILSALVALVLTIYLLGELVEVAVLYTRDAAGEWVGTKLWIVDHHGEPWVRVARPERKWFRRLRVDPRVELERGGERTAHHAIAHPEPAARAAIDAAFRAQNGAIDWLYGVLLRRDAIPIQLARAE